MKNRLSDLNDHLFAQMERLSEDGMSADQLDLEAKRAAALVTVADQIIRNADLTFKAATLVANHGDRFKPVLRTLLSPTATEDVGK